MSDAIDYRVTWPDPVMRRIRRGEPVGIQESTGLHGAVLARVSRRFRQELKIDAGFRLTHWTDTTARGHVYRGLDGPDDWLASLTVSIGGPGHGDVLVDPKYGVTGLIEIDEAAP